jgi:hypothetical protein
VAKGLIREADFYRARAIDMMKKAQSASSAITRQVYLDLAQKWTEQADSLQNRSPKASDTDLSQGTGGPAPEDSSSDN